MPAKKPQGLKKRHDTAEEKATRISDEEAMTPQRDLPLNPPAQLKGHKTAGAEWRHQIRLYNEMEAKIVTELDRGILLDLCITVEQLTEMDDMRESAKVMWASLYEMYSEMKREKTAEYETVLRTAELVETAYDKITKLDARCDQKRKLLLTLRQSLYLTPRARAAAAPAKKDKPAELDPFTELLDSAQEFVSNGCQDDKR